MSATSTNDHNGSPNEVSAAQARAALEQASTTTPVTARDLTLLSAFVAGVGLIVGAILYLSWATLSVGNSVGFIISMSSYAAALALLLAVKSRARAIPRGFQRIYNGGFVTTMTLYAVGIAWIFGHQSPWPSQAVVLAMSVVTALPCLVASIVVHRRAR
jgi:hypothetical protein